MISISSECRGRDVMDSNVSRTLILNASLSVYGDEGSLGHMHARWRQWAFN